MVHATRQRCLAVSGSIVLPLPVLSYNMGVDGGSAEWTLAVWLYPNMGVNGGHMCGACSVDAP